MYMYLPLKCMEKIGAGNLLLVRVMPFPKKV